MGLAPRVACTAVQSIIVWPGLFGSHSVSRRSGSRGPQSGVVFCLFLLWERRGVGWWLAVVLGLDVFTDWQRLPRAGARLLLASVPTSREKEKLRGSQATRCLAAVCVTRFDIQQESNGRRCRERQLKRRRPSVRAFCSGRVCLQVGVVGKYGTRYGASLRKIVKKVELQQHAKYTCPFCGKVRRSSGLVCASLPRSPVACATCSPRCV